MSHFTVAVITEKIENLEKMLEPYNENIEVEPYISRTKEQIINSAKEKKVKILKNKEEGKTISEWEYKYVDATTDEELYKIETDTYSEYDKDGNELSRYNPNSKWDWYQIGGRWNNLLLVKDDVNIKEIGGPSFFNLNSEKEKIENYRYTNICKIKDLQLEKMTEGNFEKEKRFWELIIEGQEPQNEEEKELVEWNLYNPKYYKERYSSKEEYAKWQSMFSTFAMVDENGWHEKGEMGWFACDNSTGDSERDFIKFFNDELKKPENQDKYLIIVDCHI